MLAGAWTERAGAWRVSRDLTARLGRLLAALAVLLTASGLLAPAAAGVDQGTGTPGYCPDSDGVTVIIDFQDLGGNAIIRCAPGDQPTGLAALQNAGIDLTGVQRWGLSFICRIEGKPGPDAEDCIDTPPATAYWSYWHAPNGGSWSYSQYGVMNRKPPPGGFEGWSFSYQRGASSNPPPRIAPVRPGPPVAPRPDPGERDDGIPGRDGVPTAPPVTSEREASHSTTDTPPSSASTSSTSSSAPSTTDSADRPDPSGSAAPSPGDSSDEVAWSGGEDTTSANSGGVPVKALVGGGAVVAVAAAAGVVAWRRRRASG